MTEAILVVDDSVDNLELTRILLEIEGFEVRLAEDAAKALEVLTAFRPALILMDIQLPGRDGLDLTRELRQRPALDGIPIVALSAYAMKSDEEAAAEAGCAGYITKPINTRTFVEQVRAYLTPGKH